MHAALSHEQDSQEAILVVAQRENAASRRKNCTPPPGQTAQNLMPVLYNIVKSRNGDVVLKQRLEAKL